MSGIRSLTAPFMAFLVLLGTAGADPITITSGHIAISGAQDVDSRGFLRSIDFDFSTESFRVSGGDPDGPTQNVLSPQLSFPNGLSLPATLTLPGGSPELIGLLSELTVETKSALTPTSFVLTGTLSFFQLLTQAPLFTGTVAGTGTANWEFVPTSAGTSIVSGVRYEFSDAAPIPEPVTLLLVGAGLAGLAARRIRPSLAIRQQRFPLRRGRSQVT